MTAEALLQEAIHLCGILVAALLGFAIGYERKMRFKEAGIRTHTIVCIGSALMTIVSKYGFGGTDADTARVAAQIVKELFQTERFSSLIIERKGEETLFCATLNTDQEISSRQLTEIMKEYAFIRSIERCDES